MRFGIGVIAGLLMAAALAGCSAEKGTPAPDDLELPVALGLVRDADGLATTALARSTPGNPLFQQWLTAEEIAKFGPSPGVAEDLLTELKAAGFDGSVHPSGGLIVGTFNVAEAREVLGVEVIVDQDGASPVAKPTAPPKVPRQWQGQVAGSPDIPVGGLGP